jgi:hypothetical protein
VEGKGEARTGARGQEGGTAAVGVERRAWPEGRRRSGAGVRRRGTSVQLRVNRERECQKERGGGRNSRRRDVLAKSQGSWLEPLFIRVFINSFHLFIFQFVLKLF